MPDLVMGQFNPSALVNAFHQAFMAWLGTPYLYEGQDENGIDCSGVVVQVFKDIGLTINDRSSNDFVQGVVPSKLFTLRSQPALGPVLCGVFGYTSAGSTYGHMAIKLTERFVIHSTEMGLCTAANGVSGVMISSMVNLYADLSAAFDEIHLRWLNFSLFLAAHNAEG